MGRYKGPVVKHISLLVKNYSSSTKFPIKNADKKIKYYNHFWEFLIFIIADRTPT
jgi:hypothetical protein